MKYLIYLIAFCYAMQSAEAHSDSNQVTHYKPRTPKKEMPEESCPRDSNTNYYLSAYEHMKEYYLQCKTQRHEQLALKKRGKKNSDESVLISDTEEIVNNADTSQLLEKMTQHPQLVESEPLKASKQVTIAANESENQTIASSTSNASNKEMPIDETKSMTRKFFDYVQQTAQTISSKLFNKINNIKLNSRKHKRHIINA